ncbi:MAG: glycosyltransferase, partial [Rhodoglobus sp.]
MVSLRVIIDEILTPLPGGDPRYAEELTRALIAAAPRGSEVVGVVSASTEPEYEDLAARLPGLSGLYKSALARRELTLAWHRGFTRLPGGGMIHSPSLLAPLARHDRLNNESEQTIVTIHDTVAWTHPEAIGSRAAGWYQGMAARARRYADAIVVPTHAVAARLGDILEVGDRLRVIEGAASTGLAVSPDDGERRAGLGLTGPYIVASGGSTAVDGSHDALRALAHLDPEIRLVVLDAETGEALARSASELGVDPERVAAQQRLGQPDRSALLAEAIALLLVGDEVGFGLPMLDAFSLGTPVIHADADTAMELAADAG